MALTDTFVKNAKHSGSPSGDKHRDGGGMFLLVSASGKYWRMDYRFADKRKTLALGVYPAVSLAKARQRREKARELLAEGATSPHQSFNVDMLWLISAELPSVDFFVSGLNMACKQLPIEQW